jgi:hypothetical protein
MLVFMIKLFCSVCCAPAGDYTPDLAALLSADIIIATPEKWDGISRNWQSRGYVKKVGRTAWPDGGAADRCSVSECAALHSQHGCYSLNNDLLQHQLTYSRHASVCASAAASASAAAAAAAVVCRLVC